VRFLWKAKKKKEDLDNGKQVDLPGISDGVVCGIQVNTIRTLCNTFRSGIDKIIQSSRRLHKCELPHLDPNKRLYYNTRTPKFFDHYKRLIYIYEFDTETKQFWIIAFVFLPNSPRKPQISA